MASILVNSLKRLYTAGRITKEQLAERVEKGTITEADYQEITESEYEMLKSIEEISTEKAIDEYTLQLMEGGLL